MSLKTPIKILEIEPFLETRRFISQLTYFKGEPYTADFILHPKGEMKAWGQGRFVKFKAPYEIVKEEKELYYQAL